jgi:L-methionine (R)-S-oxide reductase
MKDYQVDLKWVSEQCNDEAPARLLLQRIMTGLHARNANYHWIGIYFLSGNELILGPYAGPVTDHVRIPVGRGVCGTAVAENKDQVVDDVSGLSNYLACNLETKSEMVALIRDSNQKILAQLDVDGKELALFNLAEQSYVRKLADILAPLIQRCLTEAV